MSLTCVFPESINDVFEHDTPDFIHNYRIVHDKGQQHLID